MSKTVPFRAVCLSVPELLCALAPSLGTSETRQLLARAALSLLAAAPATANTRRRNGLAAAGDVLGLRHVLGHPCDAPPGQRELAPADDGDAARLELIASAVAAVRRRQQQHCGSSNTAAAATLVPFAAVPSPAHRRQSILTASRPFAARRPRATGPRPPSGRRMVLPWLQGSGAAAAAAALTCPPWQRAAAAAAPEGQTGRRSETRERIAPVLARTRCSWRCTRCTPKRCRASAAPAPPRLLRGAGAGVRPPLALPSTTVCIPVLFCWVFFSSALPAFPRGFAAAALTRADWTAAAISRRLRSGNLGMRRRRHGGGGGRRLPAQVTHCPYTACHHLLTHSIRSYGILAA
eukprot:SAG22_NODE_2137_length_2956_cov_8.564928_3_plen_350_part_00